MHHRAIRTRRRSTIAIAALSALALTVGGVRR